MSYFLIFFTQFIISRYLFFHDHLYVDHVLYPDTTAGLAKAGVSGNVCTCMYYNWDPVTETLPPCTVFESSKCTALLLSPVIDEKLMGEKQQKLQKNYNNQ